MKKTIITLMALSCLSPDCIASDIVYTSTTIGAGSPSGGFEAMAFEMNLNGTAFTTTSSPDSKLFTKLVQLESITLNVGTASVTYKDYQYSLVVTDTDFNIVGWSTTVSDRQGEYTWNFVSDSSSTPLTLDTTKNYLVFADTKTSFISGDKLTYTGEFMRFSNTGVINCGDGKVDIAGSTSGSYSGLQFITLNKNDSNAYTGYSYKSAATGDPFDQYIPNVTIVTKAFPEPTTATLSLLALAGLAARRRRR